MSEPSNFRTTVREGAEFYHCPVSDTALDIIERYYSLLKSWNSKINLVSSGDLARFAEYHILDSLKTAAVVDYSSMHRIMDFGSGAGLPGIPIAAFFPHITMVLVESRLKRCTFLTELAREIAELSVEVMRTRVEDVSHDLDDSFDAVVSRATVKLDALYALTHRFLRPGGAIVAIKGDTIETEYNSLNPIAESGLFHISSTIPDRFGDVRQGNIVLMKKCRVVNTSPHT